MKLPTNPKEIKSELLATISQIEHELMYNKKNSLYISRLTSDNK